MKNIFILLFIFFISTTFVAKTRVAYYPQNQTRDEVMKNAKRFESDLTLFKCRFFVENMKTRYDYVQRWEQDGDGFVLSARFHYQFLDDRVIVSTLEATLKLPNGTSVPLHEDDGIKEKRDVYQSINNTFVTNYFVYLKVNKLKDGETVVVQNKPEPLFANTYNNNITKDQAKINWAAYIEKELDPTYSVLFDNRNLSNVDDLKNIKRDAVELQYHTASYYFEVKVFMKYEFCEQGFQIEMDTISYTDNETKKTWIIDENSTKKFDKELYNKMKIEFKDKHIAYINAKIK